METPSSELSATYVVNVSMLFASSDGRDHESDSVSNSGTFECQDVKFRDFFTLRLLVDSFLMACEIEQATADYFTDYSIVRSFFSLSLYFTFSTPIDSVVATPRGCRKDVRTLFISQFLNGGTYIRSFEVYVRVSWSLHSERNRNQC